jgi:hypothetical protein
MVAPLTLRDLLAPYVSIDSTPIPPCEFAATFRCADVEYGTMLTTEEPVGWADLARHLRELHGCEILVRIPSPDGEVVHRFPVGGHGPAGADAMGD